MTKRTYYILWALFYILCARLGFIPGPTGAAAVFFTGLSVCFFIPPSLLVYFAGKKGDMLTLKIVRNLCAASLGLTVALLLANFFCLMAPEAVGNILYAMLVIVSSPMVCSGYWALSLFLWACLLIASQGLLRKK